MEISNAYSKALELEGLLLLLKSENTDNFKIDLILTRLSEKMDEINADIIAIRRQYQLELYHAAEQHVKENSQIVPAQETAAAVNTADDNEPGDTICHDCQVLHSETETIADEPGCITDVENERIEDNAMADSALFEEEEDADMFSPDTKAPLTDDSFELHEYGKEEIREKEDSVAPETSVNIVIEDSCVDVNRSAFALSTRGDIRKVFTLNDNYKFRRLLFSNSPELYAETLLKVENMKSTFEAEDYFYNTLKWDKENPDVKDFMTTISAYFLGK